MNIPSTVKLLFFLFAALECLADDPRVKLLEDRLNQFKQDPTMDKMLGLVDTVEYNFNFPDRVSPDVKAVTLEVRAALTTYPPHANYYRDRISEATQILSDLDKDEQSHAYGAGYQAIQTIDHSIAILRLLPSPQTVHVLGELLYDHSRELKAEDKQKLIELGTDPMTVFSSLSLAEKATNCLNGLGIRNGPQAKISSLEIDLDIWPLWYEQVRAGTRSFSFEGQDVEYRFKKDGTWITTPLTSKAVPGDNKSNATGLPEQPAQQDRRPWYWLIGIILITAIGLLWQKRKSALG